MKSKLLKWKLLVEMTKYAWNNPEAKPWVKVSQDVLFHNKKVDQQVIDNIALQLELQANACKFAMIAMNKYDSSMYKDEKLLRLWKNELLTAA